MKKWLFCSLFCLLIVLAPVFVFAGCSCSVSSKNRTAEKKYKVVFYAPDAGYSSVSLVESGLVVTSQKGPKKSGYKFDCWCIDPEKTIAYDFSTPVTHDITLYARYYDGNLFIVSKGSYACVTGCKDGATTVTIPSMLNNKYVKEIGEGAFRNKNIQVCTIPNTVTKISKGAFEYCKSLISVALSKNLKEIGNNAFYGCSSLSNISIPSGVALVGDSAFANCTQLQTATISAKVINFHAFSGCTNLKNVDILEGVQEIKGSAFDGCSALEKISLPNSVVKIGSWAFPTSSSIEYNTREGAKYLGNKNNPYLYLASIEDKTITETGNMLDDVRFISRECFSGCSSLQTVSISSSVVSIGYRAFEGCSQINRVDYGGTIAEWCSIEFGESNIGPSYYQNDLVTNPVNFSHNLYIENQFVTDISAADLAGLTKIGTMAFAGCNSLVSVELPNTITIIGDCAFVDCSNLENITISNSVLTVGSMAFANCDKISKLTIPNTINNVGPLAFDSNDTFELEYLGTINDWCKIPFGHYILYNGNLWYYGDGNEPEFTSTKNIVINDTPISEITSISAQDLNGIQTLYSYVFCNFENLQSVEFPASVTLIDCYAFKNCVGFTNITIPDSVTTINLGAFSGCSGLLSVDLPFCGRSGDDRGSDDCGFGYIFGNEEYENSYLVNQEYRAEKTYYIPLSLETVTIRGGYLDGGAFSGCTMLTNIILGDNDINVYIPYWHSDLFYGLTNLQQVTIPKKGLNERFYNCTNLERINYNGTLAEWCSAAHGEIQVPYSLYIGGEKVTELTPENTAGATSVSQYAFYNNRDLTSVELANTVTSIGDNAFYKCLSLTSVTIPASAKTFGWNIFEECESLIEVNYAGTISDWCKINFVGNPFSAFLDILTINGKSLGEFTSISAENFAGVTAVSPYAFKGFVNLQSVELPDDITSIGESAFYECPLTSIVIPDSVTSIGRYAFYNCTALESIEFGENSSLNTIDEFAFSGCNSLESFVIPSGVIRVESYLFYGCTSLASVRLSNITVISYAMFEHCSNLQSIIIPASVVGIEGAAFHRCDNLREVVIASLDVYNAADGIKDSNAGYLTEYATNIYVLRTIVDNVNNTNEYLNNEQYFTKSDGTGDYADYYVYTRR